MISLPSGFDREATEKRTSEHSTKAQDKRCEVGRTSDGSPKLFIKTSEEGEIPSNRAADTEDA